MWLDPNKPESLVYRVDGSQRTLVSAMFIANARPLDDPELVDYGGPLMQWHNHDNLCWGLDDNGNPVVKGITDDAGNCPAGTVKAGGENPMVHVWIAPHECGPFAALEGHGAGQVAGDGQRVDQCGHGHATTDDHSATVAPTPYDPNLPIDLSGVEGVTPQQQAFAENLVGATVRDLPQWADPAVAEAAGFRSIGDGLTGHEHYIQWAWIDDDVWLDADFPESLVYEPQPDGTKKLVSAMFMLRPDTPLDEVPDWGGALMQWHIHDDLCFTDGPERTTGREHHVGWWYVPVAVGQVRAGADDPRLDRPPRSVARSQHSKGSGPVRSSTVRRVGATPPTAPIDAAVTSTRGSDSHAAQRRPRGA